MFVIITIRFHFNSPGAPYLLRVGREEPEEGIPVQIHQLNIVCRDVNFGNCDCGVVFILYAQIFQHGEQCPALARPGCICKRRAMA